MNIMKSKLMKRIIGITLCMAMVASISLPLSMGAVSAEKSEKKADTATYLWYATDNDEFTPRGPLCTSCGASYSWTINTTPWSTVGFQACPKSAVNNDRIQERSVIRTYYCSNCYNRGDEVTIETQVSCTH